MEIKYARRMADVKASDIREILKVAENPEVISFAGGLPAPELFPIEEVKAVSQMVLEESGMRALQYSSTEGYLPLRTWIAERMNKRYNMGYGPDNIQLVHGSQQTLDITGKVFLDEGDVVLCEVPTYLAALSAFRIFGCTFAGVDTDDDGMIPEALERTLKENPRAKLIYVVPDFQNPSGRSWSRERRQALADLSAKYGVMVLEDSPYSELRFAGEHQPSVQALGGENLLYSGTFSKTFCPAFRLGWVAGHPDIVRKYTLVKQSTDLQCNTLAQMELAKYLEVYDIDAHIAKILEVYKRRRDLTIRLMEQEFPAGIRFTRPEGGLFTWVTMPEGINTRDLLEECLKENVMFVPGQAFFPNNDVYNTFRFNYSCMNDERIEEGIMRLARVLNQYVK